VEKVTDPCICDACVYYDADASECHRHAPAVAHDGTTFVALWPIVKPHDWCGDSEREQWA
jgi:hypothetical protein